MWAHDVDSADYAERLARIEATLSPGRAPGHPIRDGRLDADARTPERST